MSLLRFDGRSIITGVGCGLGRAHALLFASRGARVIVNDLGGHVDGSGSSAGPVQEVIDEIERAGGAAVPDGHSVATSEGDEAIVHTALAKSVGSTSSLTTPGSCVTSRFPT